MKYVYPAIFTEEDGRILVSVPDLPGANTFGDDLADAIYMAENAIEMWICDAENKGEDIPVASSTAALSKGLKKGTFINLIAADTDEYRRRNDTRAVKKTVSIPSWLNYQAERANAPFSQVLQEGLKKYLDTTK